MKAAALNAGPILLALVFVSCWQLVLSSHVVVIKNSSTIAAVEEISSNASTDDNSEDKWLPKCSGTWSLLGVREWNATNLRCCESDGMCHGFNPQTVEKLVIGSLKGLLNVTSRHLPTKNTFTFQRSQSSSTNTFEGSGDDAIKEEETTNQVEIVEEGSGSSSFVSSSSPSPSFSSSTSSFAPCCRSKVSAFLPVTGISATSGKRMAVIQIEQFQQYAVSEHCSKGACRFLRGNCTQVYSPQPLYVLSTEGSGDTSKLAAKLDFILVESGCRCHQHRLGDQQEEEQMDDDGVEASLSKMGVDTTVPKELRFITGVDFQEDYLAALLALADSDNSIDDTNNSLPPIDRQTDDPWLPSHDFTASLETGRVTDPVTFITTTPSSWITTGTQATTQLPLPVLPDKHGAPLHIPEGHFNPVLLSIQKFLLTTPAAHRHRQSVRQSVN